MKLLKQSKVYINRPNTVSPEVSKNKNNIVGTIIKVDKDKTCLVSTFANPAGSWEADVWLCSPFSHTK